MIQCQISRLMSITFGQGFSLVPEEKKQVGFGGFQNNTQQNQPNAQQGATGFDFQKQTQQNNVQLPKFGFGAAMVNQPADSRLIGFNGAVGFGAATDAKPAETKPAFGFGATTYAATAAKPTTGFGAATPGFGVPFATTTKKEQPKIPEPVFDNDDIAKFPEPTQEIVNNIPDLPTKETELVEEVLQVSKDQINNKNTVDLNPSSKDSTPTEVQPQKQPTQQDVLNSSSNISNQHQNVDNNLFDDKDQKQHQQQPPQTQNPADQQEELNYAANKDKELACLKNPVLNQQNHTKITGGHFENCTFNEKTVVSGGEFVQCIFK